MVLPDDTFSSSDNASPNLVTPSWNFSDHDLPLVDPKTNCDRRIPRRYVLLSLLLILFSLLAVAVAMSNVLIRNGRDVDYVAPQMFSAPELPPSVVCDTFYCSLKDGSFNQTISLDCDCSLFLNITATTISSLYSAEANLSLFDCIDHPKICTNNTIRSFISAESGNPKQLWEPTHLSTEGQQPIPTNVWWGNLIHPFPSDGSYKSYPVFPHPYMIQYKFHSNDFTDSLSGEKYPYGVHLSHLPPYRLFGPSPEPGRGSVNGSLYMYHWYTTDIIVSALDIVHQEENQNNSSTTNAKYVVTDWDRDGFGVSIRIDIASDDASSGDKYMQMTLVQGMALVTTEYENCIPTIQFGHISNIIYESDTNDKWIVEMDITHYNNNNVTKQHWVIYADPPIEWKQEESLESQKWVAVAESYSGVVRMAKLPDAASLVLSDQPPVRNCENSADSFVSQDLAPFYNLYDPYRDCIVSGGSVHVPTSETTNTSLYYMLKWRTVSPCLNGILHFGLPHQASMILWDKDRTLHDGPDALNVSDTVTFQDFVFESPTRGMMQAYVSLSGIWRLNLGLKPMKSYLTTNTSDIRGVFLPESVLTNVDDIESIDLVSSLYTDIFIDEWSIPKDGSYYFNGKAVQKFATLCLLANQTLAISRMNSSGNIGNWNSTALEGLFDHCMIKLGSIMDTFSRNAWTYPLVYDEMYNGVVSSQGFLEVNNTFADFGNTVYNDHHYHWGYWIVASSIYLQLSQYHIQSAVQIGRTYALTNMVNSLIRDAVNPAPNDAFFPVYRLFNWFYGHSLANGIFPSLDGKNEESISEEMNFHYGVYLWGFVTRNRVLEHLGQLLLTVNARSIETYFLSTNDNLVHPAPIRFNKVTGIMFDSKIQYDTWFCDTPECIHGIQMLPVSPITPLFRSKQFIQEEWDEVLSKIPVYEDNPTSSWISLLYVNLAHVNATFAMSKLRTVVTNFDQGLSRSWALYYTAACRLDQQRAQN